MILRISTNNRFVIFFLLFLALEVAGVSLYSVISFENKHVPIYDGVMYDYQQIRRYESFQNDFSLVNRYNQSIYEFRGNPISGLYSAFLTFVSPSFLVSKWDIFIRSFIGVFLFAISFYLYFKHYLHKKWVLLLLALLFQLPYFYHYRTGLGSSVPELISSIYLMSGFIFILSGLDRINVKYITFGLMIMFFSVLFRFNFFVYLVLFSIPLFFVLIIKWKFFLNDQRKRLILILSLFSFFFSAYISIYFSSFINYYTTGSYAFTTLSISFNFMVEIFKEYFGYVGVIIFFVIIYGNLVYKKDINLEKKQNTYLLLSFPFIIFFSFIILYLKSTNVPHIMSIMALLCTIAFVSLTLYFSYFSFSKRISLRMIGLVVVGLVLFNLYSIRSQHPIDQYVSQKKVVSYLEYKLRKNPTLKFSCFYDSAIEIPIINALYVKSHILYPFQSVFNVQDIFYPKSIDFHFNELVATLSDVDIVIINATSKNKLQIGRKALGIQNKLRSFLQTHSNYRLQKIIPSSIYSDLLVFEKVALLTK